jgi:hypothetical protein
MKNILLLVLVIIGVVMIYLGATAPKLMLPPLLSGVAFIIITLLLYKKE